MGAFFSRCRYCYSALYDTERGKQILRITSLCVGFLCMLCAGTLYTYSVYASSFSEKFGYSKKELALIVSFGNYGHYFSGIAFGSFVDKYPPFVFSLLASILGFLGYFYLATTYAGRFGKPSFALLGFFTLLVGVGSTAGYFVALTTNLKNMAKQHRGVVVGAMVAASGLSAFFFTQLDNFLFVYKEATTEGGSNTYSFLLFLAIVLGGTNLLGALFLHRVGAPTPYNLVDRSADISMAVANTPSSTAIASNLPSAMKPPSSSTANMFTLDDMDVLSVSPEDSHLQTAQEIDLTIADSQRAVVVSESIEIPDTDIDGSESGFSESRRPSLSVIVTSRGELGTIILPSNTDDDDNNNLTNNANASKKTSEIIDEENATTLKEGYHAFGNLMDDRMTSNISATSSGSFSASTISGPGRGSALTLLGCIDFWMLFFILWCGVGSGLMYITNVGTMVVSLSTVQDKVAIQKGINLQVSAFSLFNCIGRFAFGFMSDFLLKRRRVARGWFILFALVILCAIQMVLIFIQGMTSLTICSLIISIAYGCLCSVTPTITSEIFGEKHFGRNWGILSCAGAIGGTFGNIIFGAIYDAASTTLPGAKVSSCSGVHCYRWGFLYSSSLCLLAVGIALVFLLRKRRNEAESHLTNLNHVETTELQPL